MNPSSTSRAWALLPVAAAVLVTGLASPLLAADPLLTRDDQTLIRPMQGVATPADWWARFQAGQVMDVQPLRDLTFVLDGALARAGVPAFHLTNLALWFGLSALVWRLLRRVAGPRSAAALTAVFLLHPAAITEVAWVSSRKHSLAAVCTVGATLLLWRWVDTQRPRWLWGATGVFGLGLFAQPIGLGWPLFALVLVFSLTRRWRWAALAPAGVVSALVGWINWQYYTGRYTAQAHATKFVDEGDLGVRVLALGRSAFNVLLPARVASTYDPGSPFNLLGLVLLAGAGWWVVRRVPVAQRAPWALFIALPLGVLYARMTHIFVSDTYLVLPLIGALVLLAAGLEDQVGRWLWPVLALEALGAFGTLQSYRSDAALWARNVEVEPTPMALTRHAFALLEAGHPEAALEASHRAWEWNPTGKDVAFVYARSLYEQPGVTAAQKQAALEGLQGADEPWVKYYRARVAAELGDPRTADQLLRAALRQSPTAFGRERAQVQAEQQHHCRAAGVADCAPTGG